MRQKDDTKTNTQSFNTYGFPDATSFAMGSAIHNLCAYDSVREALAEEVRGFREPLDFDELKQAPILNAFVAETLRKDPPAGGAQRKLTTDVEYEGYKLTKGSRVGFNVHLQTQNTDFYVDPDTFHIQRFLPANHPLVTNPLVQQAAKNVDFNGMKATFPVFGGGVHGCLGSNFARLELRILVTRLLQLYDIEELSREKVRFPTNGWKTEFRLTPRAAKK